MVHTSVTRIARSRQRTLPNPDGFYDQTAFGTSGHTTNSFPFGYQLAKCDDHIGRPTDVNDCSIRRFEYSNYHPVNGSYVSPGGDVTGHAVNYYPQYIRNVAWSHLSNDTPSPSSQMTSLLARTNPSRPDITPLTLLQDVYDLPRMLKDVGKLLKTPRRLLSAREGANQYLGAQFGWLPLVQDVHDLLDFGSHVQRRKAELDRLYSQSGLRRRLNLGTHTAEQDQDLFLESQLGLNILTKQSVTYSSRQWGTVRWKPNITPGYDPTDSDRLKLARRVCSGMTSEATIKGAWDLIPWTWMVNWFTNVHEFALQNSNTVPASSAEACVMTYQETKYHFRTISMTTGYQGGDGVVSLITKERYTGGGTISAHLPFIGVDRLKTLGALFIQRFSR